MVKSILDDTIEYNESSEIDPTDLDFEANLYETKMFEKDITFALGQAKYTYINNNIVYYPIYLVVEDEIKTQLGLYEIMASEERNILDKDGDIDLNKFDKPLLYSFTFGIINDEPIINEPIINEPIINEPIINDPIAIEAEVASKAKAKAKAKTTLAKPAANKQIWINEFFNDDKFNIINTKSDGNCFFSALKLALEEREQDVSIDDMRQLLADNADESLFQNYKTVYDDYNAREDTVTREIKNLTKRNTELKTKTEKTKDRNTQMGLLKQAEEITLKKKNLKVEQAQIKVELQEFNFMNGIENLSMLKLKIKTNGFWADTWAISTLERELNIKTIIFSEANYQVKDEINVLQCGQLNDTVLEKRGTFEPSFYVLIGYQGIHYQLITYAEDKSFLFTELPEQVKTLVVEKCLEKMAGPYSLIPEFISLKLNPNAEGAEGAEAEAAMEEISSDLYDNATVFRFYSGSADKPLPGKGSGERLGSEGTTAYNELAKIPQWRKKLANAWSAEFTVDNHKWQSVEHYYQAAKFKKNNKEFYLKFSLDSLDSDIAKSADMAKAAGDRAGKYKGELVRPKEIKIDPDFYEIKQGSKYSRGQLEMEVAMRAKFSQNADLKQLLLATKKAKLEHTSRGKPAVIFNDLMRVRRELQTS